MLLSVAVLPEIVLSFEVTCIPAQGQALPEFLASNPSTVQPSADIVMAEPEPPASTTGSRSRVLALQRELLVHIDVFIIGPAVDQDGVAGTGGIDGVLDAIVAAAPILQTVRFLWLVKFWLVTLSEASVTVPGALTAFQPALWVSLRM